MELICTNPRCKNVWNYKGQAEYATCPKCRYKIKVIQSLAKDLKPSGSQFEITYLSEIAPELFNKNPKSESYENEIDTTEKEKVVVMEFGKEIPVEIEEIHAAPEIEIIKFDPARLIQHQKEYALWPSK